MTLVVDVMADGVRAGVNRETIATLVRGVLKAEKAREAFISIAFVSDRAIAAINQEHLGHAGATDVISFAFREGPRLVGDIYIAPGVARANAKAFGVGVREELARLVVHGTLHVLGHDHPEGEARLASPMWQRQERLLARLWTRRTR
jgi:probable rRNA maturation factor